MYSSIEFALSLLRASSKHTDNFVISPFSLGATLAIVHDGAKGVTQNELTQLLGKGLSPADVSSLYSTLTSALAEQDSAVTTSVANRFFLEEKLTLKPEYQAHVAKAFNAGAETLDFTDVGKSCDYINNFVKENTGGMIPQLVTPADFRDAIAMLINAVYFKGEWKTQFNKDETLTKAFHGIGGDKDEKFMIATKLNAFHSLTPALAVVSIPYKDPSYSLVLLMPSCDFGEWRANLTAEKLQGAIQKLVPGKINLELPKFKIESTTDGKQALEKCGVSMIFDANADLSGISEDHLSVSAIVHKAVIEISEEGTEAAAATVLIMCRGRAPGAETPIPWISLNKPFLYLIVKQTATERYPLFIGAKVN